MGILIWLTICVLLGIIASRRGFNFIQGFILAVMITPPFALLAIFVCGEKYKRA